MRAGAAAAACIATLLAGCGGLGSGSGGDGSWGQRADAICDRTEKAIRVIDGPEDIGDLDRVMVRVSGQVRAAIGEIRKLDASDDERRRAKAFLADLGLVERSLDRIAGVTSTAERRPIAKAGEALRLDVVDIAAHAEAAGLTRCGREKVGIAAADSVMLPGFAESVAEVQAAFLLAEVQIARRHDPKGSARERAGYWVALWKVIERTEARFGDPPDGRLKQVQGPYFGAFEAMRDGADVYSSIAKGEVPITSERISEDEARRSVTAFKAAGFEALGELGPAGEAQLRALEGLGEPTKGNPEGQVT